MIDKWVSDESNKMMHLHAIYRLLGPTSKSFYLKLVNDLDTIVRSIVLYTTT